MTRSEGLTSTIKKSTAKYFRVEHEWRSMGTEFDYDHNPIKNHFW